MSALKAYFDPSVPLPRVVVRALSMVVLLCIAATVTLVIMRRPVPSVFAELSRMSVVALVAMRTADVTREGQQ